MKSRIVVLGLVLALFGACATPKPPTTVSPAPLPTATEPAPEPVEPETPPPLLWVAETDQGRIYLFGTMHFGVTLDELPDDITKALAECDKFVLEADPAGADPTKLAELMMLPDGPGLDEQLGAERWERLLGMIGDSFESRVAKRVQPWVLEAALLQQIMPASEPMELGLLEQARDLGLEIAYLEDWQTQIALLNKTSNASMLDEIVDDPDGFRKRSIEMSDDYIDGDVEGLRHHIFGADYPSEMLFETRNKTWLPKLVEHAHSGDVFVAIGAGHLIGEDSVLDLLEAEGLKVRRVR